ncbi:dihydrofolate reductase family protein [Asaia krungthepensis]|uniref:Bifunctional deaminase-reductase domain protein n=1 Tax=Asaia krungthepensis NRIC 0535 TaxID=1307925 RepID=A0ABQ0Q0E9_9PROT|nr:dihydrofolate reductase family protein [Asaia krungthepensis]GBQ86095.1 bifunctional deaminase-reductase domain protein [Asaia krungthepensis NRIC 0535]
MNRPDILCHMMSSIDGRIDTDRWTLPADGQARDTLVNQYFALEESFDADGWMIGRTTASAHFLKTDDPIPQGARLLPRMSHIAAALEKKLAILIDPSGKLRHERADLDGDPVVAILAESVADAYLEHLRKVGVSYCFAGEDGHDLPAAMRALHRDFGRRRLLLEGGGRINGAFLEAGLVDAISLLIYPGLDGQAGIASVFDYNGTASAQPAQGLSLRLDHVETRDAGVVWLRYSVHGPS